MATVPTETYIAGRIIQGQRYYLCFDEKAVEVADGTLSPIGNGPENRGFGQTESFMQTFYTWKPEDEVNLSTNIRNRLSPDKFTPLAFAFHMNQRTNGFLFYFTFAPVDVVTTEEIPFNPDCILQPSVYKIAKISERGSSFLVSMNDGFVPVPEEERQGTAIAFNTVNIEDGEPFSVMINDFEQQWFLTGWTPENNIGPYCWGRYFSKCNSERFPYSCPVNYVCNQQGGCDPIPPAPSDDIDEDDINDDSSLALLITLIVAAVILISVVAYVLFR